MKNIKQIYHNFIKYFNFSIKKTLIKYHNKTNNYFHNKFKISNNVAIKNFNLSIKKTLIKYYNKTNNYFDNKLKINSINKVSIFNKCLISLIALSFIYIFYLLIPTIYDKTWVQNNIENKLLKEFNINFSISSKISYEILPSPHFTLENVKILNDKIDYPKEISEIKKLKVFISQSNFFDRNKLKINKVLISDANFTVVADDANFYKDFINNKFSHKKIFIKNSNVFFRKYDNEIISIFKISKLSFYLDELNFSNKIDIKAQAFKIPFKLLLSKKFLPNSTQTETKIDVRKLKLNFLNQSNKKLNNQYNVDGLNSVSVLNSKLITSYKIKKNLILFESEESQLKNRNLKYKGRLNFNPFDLDIDINLYKLKLSKLMKSNSLLQELLKTKVLFNENISAKIKININKDLDNKLFNNAKIIFNINNGKINFNSSILSGSKIGLLKVKESDLIFNNNNLILTSNFIIDIENHKKFYSFFQTSRNLRKPIKKIFINFDYNFFDESITLKSFKIDDREPSLIIGEMITSYNNTENNQLKNFIRNKIFFNKLLTNYDG